MPRTTPLHICIALFPLLRQRQRGESMLFDERVTQRHREMGTHEEEMRRLQRECCSDVTTELERNGA